ncbi:MAG: electron transport complex, RnfABCDGE type, subunit [Clostridia bacterium]|nr:electron transport complex, RnfABCDGE type, subunit [Clostridia bacterium]
MRDYIRLSGVLFIVCAIAAVLLGFTNEVTFEKIAAQIEKANNEARQIVLPASDEFTKLDETKLAEIKANPDYSIVRDVYEAKTGGSLTGYTVMVAPKGYGGAIEMIVGIDANGTVQGIKIGTNNETPGLGKNAEKPAFSDQYKNKTWDSQISVIKSGTPKENEISAIAGSTITSKGVTEGVNKAMAVAKDLLSK